MLPGLNPAGSASSDRAASPVECVAALKPADAVSSPVDSYDTVVETPESELLRHEQAMLVAGRQPSPQISPGSAHAVCRGPLYTHARPYLYHFLRDHLLGFVDFPIEHPGLGSALRNEEDESSNESDGGEEALAVTPEVDSALPSWSTVLTGKTTGLCNAVGGLPSPDDSNGPEDTASSLPSSSSGDAPQGHRRNRITNLSSPSQRPLLPQDGPKSLNETRRRLQTRAPSPRQLYTPSESQEPDGYESPTLEDPGWTSKDPLAFDSPFEHAPSAEQSSIWYKQDEIPGSPDVYRESEDLPPTYETVGPLVDPRKAYLERLDNFRRGLSFVPEDTAGLNANVECRLSLSEAEEEETNPEARKGKACVRCRFQKQRVSPKQAW